MIRFILFLSLVGLSINVSAQDSYSKIFDLSQVEASDLFTAMIEKDGFLYLIARYDYLDPLNEINTGRKVLKMDLLGNILNERTFPWMQEQSNYGMNMLIENNSLFILNSYESLYQNDKNTINLLELNLELDSIQIIEYNPIVSNPLTAADASLTSFKDHFIATGWVGYNIDEEYIPTAFHIWINKNDLSVDTTYTFPSKLIEPDSLVLALMNFSFSNEEGSKIYIFSKSITRNTFENFNKEEIGFLVYDSIDDENIEYIADTLGTYGYDNTPFLTSRGHLLYEKQGPWQFENEFILKNSDGSLIWKNLDIPLNPYGQKTISSFMETADGDIIGCGYSNWHFEYGQSNPDTITHFQSPYLIKLDIETGEILWERFIIDYDEDGEVAGNYFANVVEADNGDLICAGFRYNNLANPSLFSSDSWLVRLDEYGCNPDLSCDDLSFLSSTEDKEYTQRSALNIFPNPVKDKLHIELPVGSTDGRLIIRNTEGSLCMQQDISSISKVYTLDISSYTSGIYFIEYIPEDNLERLVFTTKVVVE